MENIPPTEKEKMLMNILVKKYSKQELFQELVRTLGDGLNSPLVKKIYKLIGIEGFERQRLEQQYLNYAINNYEQIKEGNFPDKFERVQILKTVFSVKETVIREYGLRLPYLPSFNKPLLEDLKQNFYEWDPDIDDERQTDDIEIIGKKFNDLGRDWNDNIIK
jgi:hypothetical protein